MRDLTDAEQHILNHLADAFNETGKMLQIHPSDLPEMAAAIHAAQNIILARPAAEMMQRPQASDWVRP